jgi:hypothetical protein
LYHGKEGGGELVIAGGGHRGFSLEVGPHAAAGRFTRHEKVSPLHQLNGKHYHQIFYTLPSEEWRVNAMLELLALPGAWSNQRERRYGTLLGYKDWQNDLWLFRHPVR